MKVSKSIEELQKVDPDSELYLWGECALPVNRILIGQKKDFCVLVCHFQDVKEAAKFFEDNPDQQRVVIVKGS